MSKGHLTAISRTKLSTPAKYLVEAGKIQGMRVLDYGCGRGDDARALGFETFDPYYRPNMPNGSFDVVVCNFVLNVIPDESERNKVIAAIRSKLVEGGTAYVSVRNDKKKLKGLTKRGTWQGFIELDFPVEKKTATFVMYRVTR